MKIIAKEWLNYAERDLQDAGLLYGAKSYKNCILHCHQAIEKLLKAVIIQKGHQLIRTHDLISLADSAKLELPESVMDFIGQLNPHYLPVKYPDVTLKFSYTKAKVCSILNKTKEVFRWLRLESSRKT